MRANLNFMGYPLRSIAAKVWMVLVVALTLFVGATAGAQAPKQNIVLSQTEWINTFGSGGALSSADTAGTTFAVNSNGDIIASNEYGNEILLFDRRTGVSTSLGSYQNPGPVLIDSQNNIYLGGLYTNVVVKVPYVNGTYAAVSSPSVNSSNGALISPAPCTGSDTVECGLAFSSDAKTNYLDSPANGYYFGVAAMAFDAAGDLFYVTDNAGSTGAYAIFECDTKCIASGTDKPVMVYQEPTSSNAATVGQLNIGNIAFDPWGNLFFTDSALSTAGSAESVSSNVKELPTSTGVGFNGATTGFAAAPTVLQTMTNASPGSYDDEIDGIAVDGNGTVYYASQYDGVWAFPNNSGTVDTASIYGISNQGSKLLQVGPGGNLFIATYSTVINSGGADTLARIKVNSISAGAIAVGKSATGANIVVMDNNGGNCTTPPTITFTASENGAATTEFGATIPAPVAPAKTSCSSQAAGTAFPVSLTFGPTNVGVRVAVLTASDGTNSGAATASGNGQGSLVTLDPGVWTSYTSGFTDPQAISVDSQGDIVVADAGANKVFWIGAGTTTLVPLGTGFNAPDATAFDANGNLYIADSGNNQIVEIANVVGSALKGSVDGSNQSVFISSSVTFGGKALGAPSGLAFGPGGVLYIADLQNGRVVSYNPSNGLTAVRVSGLSFPWGVAIDRDGNLIVAETGGGKVWVYSGGGVTDSFAFTAPWGVAVDPSGSLLVSDRGTGKVTRIPNEAGTLNAADAIVIATNPMTAEGLAIDVNGNIYTTDGTGAAAYAIQRTAAAVNFGAVDDDSNSILPIWVESAGNLPLTLGSPIFSAPTNAADGFTLEAAATGGCTSKSGAVGTVCTLDAEFAPPNDLAANPYTSTSTLSSNALNAASATMTLSGSAVFENLTAQTITFTAPTSPVTYGAAAITLSATGGASGNPVTFSVLSGPGMVKGSSLIIAGAGSVVVAANQAGNSTYQAAPQVTHAVVVNKAGLLVKANNETVEFGKAIPAFTYTATGFVNGDTAKTALTGAPAETSTGKKGSPVGTYPIVIKAGTLKANNYTFAFKDGTLTIKSLGVAKTPTFKPASGTFETASVKVTLLDATVGAVIHYTLNGKTPTITSPKYDAATGIVIKTAGKTTIKAIAVAPGYTESATATGVYTLKPPTASPNFVPGPGTYAAGKQLRMSDATAGAAIYYTTNGKVPTVATGTKYTGPITLTAGTWTIKAIALAPDHSVSLLVTGKYTVTP